MPLLSQGKKYLASETFDPSPRKHNRVRLAFYNVENLFDYFDDSTTRDEEFLPTGKRHWTKKRYQDKIRKIAKTVIALGGWEPPTLVGLCEVENRYVLEGLTHFTLLKSVGYEIVHQDSPDRRGIDVALLYRPGKFRLINYEYYPVRFPFDPNSYTRDILHATGVLSNQDTLHFFVNHWPSKYGGAIETIPKRMAAASLLRKKVDSLFTIDPDAYVIISGDFNDEPHEKSLLEGLSISTKRDVIKKPELYNLMYGLRHKTGTHSFQNQWGLLDQFIVSGSFFGDTGPSITISQNTAQIFDMDWLMMESTTGSPRPFRTYQGFKYIGGYSDHLPILIDLVLKHPTKLPHE